MHASELLYVATAVASSCRTFMRTPLAKSSASLQEYWAASRERFDRWGRALAKLEEVKGRESASPPASKAAETNPTGEKNSPPHQPQSPIRPVIEEILLSEVLTRVWTAATVAYDEHQQGQITAPVARSIFLGHQEARNRALSALLHGSGLSQREVRRLNLLRQKCERWTDLFLAQIPLGEQKNEMAFDPGRVAEFAEDLTDESSKSTKRAANALTLASLQAAAKRGISSTPANAVLNQRIASGVLSCLPPDALDSTGLFTSLWETRIESTANDTLSMVEELLSLD